MKRVLKITSLIALCLILVGTALGICGWIAGGTVSFAYIPEEHKFVTDTNETFTIKEEVLESFTDINILVDYVDINILTGEQFSISYPDTDYNKVIFNVENDKLTVSTDSTHKISFLSFSAMNTKEKIITITVPKDTKLDQITYKNDLGDCKIKDITFNDLVFQTDCGNTTIENVSGKSIDLKSDNGDIGISNNTLDVMELDLNLGNCNIDKLESTTANLKLDSGNCKITDSSIDEFTYDGNLGKLEADKLICKNTDLTLDSGDCSMTDTSIDKLNAELDLGNITLSLWENKEDYTINLEVDLGNIKIDGKKQDGSYTYDGDKAKSIEITSDSGDIELDFEK